MCRICASGVRFAFQVSGSLIFLLGELGVCLVLRCSLFSSVAPFAFWCGGG